MSPQFTIWKYPIPLKDSFDLEMPRGALILSVQTQRLFMWALVDLAQPKETRTFYLAGTGNPFPVYRPDAFFIGTFQLQGGSLVFHLFGLPPTS